MASVSATSPRESHGTLRRTECCSAIMPLVREVVERTRENNPPSQTEISEKRELYLRQLPQEKICKNCRDIFLKPFKISKKSKTKSSKPLNSGLMRTTSVYFKHLPLNEIVSNNKVISTEFYEDLEVPQKKPSKSSPAGLMRTVSFLDLSGVVNN